MAVEPGLAVETALGGRGYWTWRTGPRYVENTSSAWSATIRRGFARARSASRSDRSACGPVPRSPTLSGRPEHVETAPDCTPAASNAEVNEGPAAAGRPRSAGRRERAEAGPHVGDQLRADRHERALVLSELRLGVYPAGWRCWDGPGRAPRGVGWGRGPSARACPPPSG